MYMESKALSSGIIAISMILCLSFLVQPVAAWDWGLLNPIGRWFCADDCQLFAKRCSTNHLYMMECGDYDFDPCLEWPADYDIGAMYECTGGCGGDEIICELNPDTGSTQCIGQVFCNNAEGCIYNPDTGETDCQGSKCPVECIDGAYRCARDSDLGLDVIYKCAKSTEQPWEGCFIWKYMDTCGTNKQFETGKCCPGGMRCQRVGEGELCDTQSECHGRQDTTCSDDGLFKVLCYMPDVSSNIWKWAYDVPEEQVYCPNGCLNGGCLKADGTVRIDKCQSSYNAHRCWPEDPNNYVQYARGTDPDEGCPVYVEGENEPPYLFECPFGCDRALDDCKPDPNPEYDIGVEICVVDHKEGAVGEKRCTGDGYRQCEWDHINSIAVWSDIFKCPSGRCIGGECTQLTMKGYDFSSADMKDVTHYLSGLVFRENYFWITGADGALSDINLWRFHTNGTLSGTCNVSSVRSDGAIDDIAYDGQYIWIYYANDTTEVIIGKTTFDCDTLDIDSFDCSGDGCGDAGSAFTVNDDYFYIATEDMGIMKYWKNNITYTGEYFCYRLSTIDGSSALHPCGIGGNYEWMTTEIGTDRIFPMVIKFYYYGDKTYTWMNNIKQFNKDGYYYNNFNATFMEHARNTWHVGIDRWQNKLYFLWPGDDDFAWFNSGEPEIEIWNVLETCDSDCAEGSSRCSGKQRIDCVKTLDGCFRWYQPHLIPYINTEWAAGYYGISESELSSTDYYSSCDYDERCYEYWVNHIQTLTRCESLVCQTPPICNSGETMCADGLHQMNCTQVNMNPNPWQTPINCWEWPTNKSQWVLCTPGECSNDICIGPINQCSFGSSRCHRKDRIIEGQLKHMDFIQYCRDVDNDGDYEWDYTNLTDENMCFWGCNETFDASTHSIIASCVIGDTTKTSYKSSVSELSVWLGQILFPDAVSRMFFVFIITGILGIGGMLMGGVKIGLFSSAIVLIVGMMTGWLPPVLLLIPIAIIGLYIYGRINGGG